jgi:hypothetical protein
MRGARSRRTARWPARAALAASSRPARIPRARVLERLPQLRLAAPGALADHRQLDDDRAVGGIGAARQVRDAVQQDRARRVEKHFLGVGVQLAGAEAAAGRKPAQRVRQIAVHARQIVKGDDVRGLGGDHQVALILGAASGGGACGVDQAAQDPRGGAFGAALLAGQDQDRIGAAGMQTADQTGDKKAEVVVGLGVDEVAQQVRVALAEGWDRQGL